MSNLVRLRIFLSLVGIIIWASGAFAERRGEPWGGMAMTVGLSIMVVSVALRFLKPKPPVDTTGRDGNEAG
jgi:hypothetical protein